MINLLSSLKTTYTRLNKITKIFISISISLYIILLLFAIAAHFSGAFELLLLQDDFLLCSKSIIFSGITGSVALEYLS